MFSKRTDSGYKKPIEGIRLKTLVHGDRMSLVEFRLEKGKDVPNHHHPHEQSGYLVSGRITMIIGEKRFEAQPGDSWCIPGSVSHGAEVHERSVIVECFSPVREDYLDA